MQLSHQMHHESIAEERKEGKLQKFGPSQAKNIELRVEKAKIGCG